MELLIVVGITYLIVGILVAKSFFTMIVRSTRQDIALGLRTEPFYNSTVGLVIYPNKVKPRLLSIFIPLSMLIVIIGPILFIYIVLTSSP